MMLTGPGSSSWHKRRRLIPTCTVAQIARITLGMSSAGQPVSATVPRTNRTIAKAMAAIAAQFAPVMSASIWVPLVTAGAGLIAGLVTGLGSTVLARRWAREDRLAAWQREDRLRWQADRLQVYARLISALDAWNAEIMRLVGATREAQPFDPAEWERHTDAVSELTALVFLTAPEEVSDLAHQCMVAFGSAGAALSRAGETDDYFYAEWRAAGAEAREVSRANRGLAEAMRADLGLGGDGQRAPRAEPRPAG